MVKFVLWICSNNKKNPHNQFHTEAQDLATAITNLNGATKEKFKILGVSEYYSSKKTAFQNNSFH